MYMAHTASHAESFFFFFTTVLSQWDFSCGKFGLLSLGKASCDRVTLPNLRCMLGVVSVSIIHRTLTWTTGSLTCAQMLMHAIAHGDVRTHVRESALKVDSGRKIPRLTGESNMRQRRDGPMLWPTELHLHPCLHFISTVFFSSQILHSPLYRQGSRRCAEGADRKLTEIEAGQSDAQTH